MSIARLPRAGNADGSGNGVSPDGNQISGNRGRPPQRRPAVFGPIGIWLWAALAVVPLLWVIVQSLRPDVDFLTSPWSLPDLSTISVESYVTAFTAGQMGVFFGNSTIVVAAVVTLVLIMSIGAGYALSRTAFLGRRFFSLLVIATLAFPGSILLLPMFLVTNDLGLLDTRLALVIPYSTFTLPLAILLMKNAFDGLPSELFESARIDGCSEWKVFWRIALPLTPSAISTVGFLVFMPVWEEFLWAFIALRSSDNFTVPIGLVFLDENKVTYGYNVGFAGMVLTALPVVLALLVAQRGFLRAITAGALKG